MCDAIGYSAVTGWAAVLWPVIAFGATQLVGRLRHHVVLAGRFITALCAAFWIPVLMIVSSNWLAD